MHWNQIRTAFRREIPVGGILADAGYGTDTEFLEVLTDLGLLYVVGILSSVTVWKPGQGPLPAARWKGQGRPTKYLRRDRRHASLAAKNLAPALPPQAWKKVRWREGTRKPLQSRFAAVQVGPAHRDFETNPIPSNGC